MTSDKDSLDDLAAAVGRLLLARPATMGRSRLVAVDGLAGAGKTTLAALLQERLEENGASTAVLHMDDLYEGWSALEGAAPRALERRVLEQVLQPWAAGATARWQRYDWFAGQFAEWNDLPVRDVLILEGCGSGAKRFASYLTVLVWLEAAPETRLRRGLERGGEQMRPQWEAWMVSEALYFAGQDTRQRADFVRATG